MHCSVWFKMSVQPFEMFVKQDSHEAESFIIEYMHEQFDFLYFITEPLSPINKNTVKRTKLFIMGLSCQTVFSYCPTGTGYENDLLMFLSTWNAIGGSEPKTAFASTTTRTKRI